MPWIVKIGWLRSMSGLALGACLVVALAGSAPSPATAGPIGYKLDLTPGHLGAPASALGKQRSDRRLSGDFGHSIYAERAPAIYAGRVPGKTTPSRLLGSFAIDNNLLDAGVLGPDEDFSASTVRRLLGIDPEGSSRRGGGGLGIEDDRQDIRQRGGAIAVDRGRFKRREFLNLVSGVEDTRLRGAIGLALGPSVDKKGYVHFSPFGLKHFDILEQTTEQGEPNFNARPWHGGTGTSTFGRDHEADHTEDQSAQAPDGGYPLLFQLLRIAVGVVNLATSPIVIALAAIAGLLWASYKSITLVRRFRRRNRFSVRRHRTRADGRPPASGPRKSA